MSASLSPSLKSSSRLLANSSWSFFLSVLAFSQALARVFSFCTAQQEKGISSVTGIGSECFRGESAGCDCGTPSSRLPVAALIRTLLSPALPVSPAKAPPQLHNPTYGKKETSNNTESALVSDKDEEWSALANISSQHTLSPPPPPHFQWSSTWPCWPFQAARWLSSEWWSHHQSSWEARKMYCQSVMIKLYLIKRNNLWWERQKKKQELYFSSTYFLKAAGGS